MCIAVSHKTRTIKVKPSIVSDWIPSNIKVARELRLDNNISDLIRDGT